MIKRIQEDINKAQNGDFSKNKLINLINQYEHDIAVHVAPLVQGGNRNLSQLLYAKLDDLKNVLISLPDKEFVDNNDSID